MKKCIFTFLVAVLPGSALLQSAYAQQLTPDPNAWRPVSYTDLQLPGEINRSFVEIWADHITRNNKEYIDKGDTRFAVGNAPVTESHFVVRSPTKTVVLSVLNTATGCTIIGRDEIARTVLKTCPMRLAVYAGDDSIVLDAGTGCFLEFAAGEYTPDPTRSASYASYDVPTRTIRTGAILAKEAIDRCIIKVPVPRT